MSSAAKVVAVMKIATKYHMPVVAYSGGTSLEGAFSGIEGGCICVDMSGMNRILEIHGKLQGFAISRVCLGCCVAEFADLSEYRGGL